MTLDPPVRPLLAPNPSPLTGAGTNTWLVGATALAVIDPGPDDDAHLAAILDAARPGQHISHILVTHAHRDHSALAPRLKQNFAIVRGVEYRVGQNIAKQTPQQPSLALDNQAGRYAVAHVLALRAALKSEVSGQFGQQAA